MVPKEKILKASIGFIFYAVIFVLLPLAFLYFVQQSPELPAILSQAKTMLGIDVNGIIITIAIAGAIVAMASLMAGLTESWSPMNLIPKIVSSLLRLFISLTLIGLGDAASMGYVAKSIYMQQAGIQFILDLRFFAIAMALVTSVELFTHFLEYAIARKEKSQIPSTEANESNARHALADESH